MIVKMNKYAFMVYHKEFESFLATIQELGVVHVRETRSIAENDELQGLLKERKRISNLLRGLKHMVEEAKKLQALKSSRQISKEEGLDLLSQIEELQEKRIQLFASKQQVEKEISNMAVWGDFDFDQLDRLEEAGYVIGFHTCPTAKFEPKWVDQYNAILIDNFQSLSYFITLTPKGVEMDIDADEAKLPEHSWKDLQRKKEEIELSIQQVEDEILQFAIDNVNTIEILDNLIVNEFSWVNIHHQTKKEAEERLMYLEGWVPEEKVEALEKELDVQNYYFEQIEITDQDTIPIKLTNNRFSKLFEPITRMFSLPNYSEIDPTPLLAPFFMLFFGLCFGDGGYGVLIVLACTLLKKKVSEEIRPILSLFQYLGGAAVFVGTITGSFFGIELAKVEAFAPVKEYFLNSDNLMTLSIVIGLIQILFGKCVAAYKIKLQRGFKHSVAPFAWVFIIAALLIALGLPMLDIQLPQFIVYTMYGIAGAAGLLAFLYNSPGQNVFLNVGKGVYKAYEVASGLLGDTLSYIRLFAIGLTGSILGGVFNTLAISMTEDLNVVVRIFAMLLILLTGHAINFGLCTISSLVHPLRLIFVEYYKNAEFEGGGKEYNPYRKV